MNLIKRNTKSGLLFLLILVLSLITYTACQKQNNDQQFSETYQYNYKNWFLTDIVENEKKSFLSQQSTERKITNNSIYFRMEKLGKMLNWNKAKEYNKEGIRFHLVPVNQEIKPFTNQNYEAVRFAVFSTDKERRIRFNIIEIISKKTTILGNNTDEIAAVSFSNKFSNKNNSIPGLNANVIFYDKNYKSEASYQFKNGEWSDSKIKLVNKKGNTTKKRMASTMSQSSSCGSCTTWYLVGFWYDTQTGQVTDYDILAEWDECTQGTPPPAGYGDSPTPQLDEDCSESATEALSNLVAASNVSNETLSITTVESKPETRTKKYEWVILRNIGWFLFSWETGVHQKTFNSNPSLQWKWRTLEHENISRVGIVVGGSIEYSVIVATPTVGLYNAVMDLDFKVTYSVACKGSPISSEQVYNSVKSFNVND